MLPWSRNRVTQGYSACAPQIALEKRDALSQDSEGDPFPEVLFEMFLKAEGSPKCVGS